MITLNKQQNESVAYGEPLQANEHANMLVNPKKFILWLFIGTIVMLFAAFTSAYIVKKDGGTGWSAFELPHTQFLTSTIIVVLSSVTMQMAYFSGKKGNMKGVKLALFSTFVLSVGFLASQWSAFVELQERTYPIFFGGAGSNNAGEFLYALAGIHAAHIVMGVGFLIYALVIAAKKINQSRMVLNLEMCGTFWHFLGGLWLYLYIFLTVNHA